MKSTPPQSKQNLTPELNKRIVNDLKVRDKFQTAIVPKFCSVKTWATLYWLF